MTKNDNPADPLKKALSKATKTLANAPDLSVSYTAKIAVLALIGGVFAVYWPQPASTTGTSSASAECQITHVVDGDTLDLKCSGTEIERIRILGYDTPETYYAECPSEKRLGDEATERLRTLAASQPVTRVTRNGSDRYDRTLATIWLGGIDLAETMVSEGLAVRYSGGQRINWCERLANSGTN